MCYMGTVLDFPPLQRQANDEYLGELYVERDFKEEDRKGSTCRWGIRKTIAPTIWFQW